MNYTDRHVNPVSYAEFGLLVESLISKIQILIEKEKIQIDGVAPVLRSGGVAGSMIAVHFRVPVMFPLQFKYHYQPRALKQVLQLPPVPDGLPRDPVILICENNTTSGKTARGAIDAVKQQIPHAKILYATVSKVFGGPDTIEGAEHYFYGICTNENFLATQDQEREMGLRPGIAVYPWEVISDELREMNGISSFLHPSNLTQPSPS